MNDGATPRLLPKAPTGIQGLDEITEGGLPRGRATLVCGGAGCGKTLLAIEFLVRGATEFGEPGVFVAFEETAEELAQNVRSIGFDLDALVAQKKLVVDFVRIERSEIEETGDYDLEGLFVRLGYAIDSIGAKRVALDTVETLFSALSGTAILRAELRRLFGWMKAREVSAIITGERGEGTLTRFGLEEYVSDCVISLDHRVHDEISTRRLRIVKYRGTTHGTNEYSFLIDEHGFSVMPLTSVGLEHPASDERVSTGIPRLDAMLGGKGCFRGSTILLSGMSGSGKTSIAAQFVDAACARGERCLYVAFEESRQQITRNMRSIGLDLERWIQKGLLRIHPTRSTRYGLEMHLVTIEKLAVEMNAQVLVLDHIGNLTRAGNEHETAIMLVRLIDFLKMKGITAIFAHMIARDEHVTDATDLDVSSLVDTWLSLRDIESNGERNRALYVLKSRGMAHSNQVREFRLTDHGVELVDAYIGMQGVLTGSARIAQEAHEKAAALEHEGTHRAKERERARKREALEARITALRKEFAAEEEESDALGAEETAREQVALEGRQAMTRSRKADNGAKMPGGHDGAAPAKRK
jgi:circadian clock protein KaiC